MVIEATVHETLIIPRSVLQQAGLSDHVRIIVGEKEVRIVPSPDSDAIDDLYGFAKDLDRGKGSVRMVRGAAGRMGRIRIVGLDTNIFLNQILEEENAESTMNLMQRIGTGQIAGVASSLVLAEIATLFHRNGRINDAEYAVNRLRSIPNLLFVDLCADMALRCARNKVSFGLSLADAIILTAAEQMKADVFLTRDSDFATVDLFPVCTPEELPFVFDSL